MKTVLTYLAITMSMTVLASPVNAAGLTKEQLLLPSQLQAASRGRDVNAAADALQSEAIVRVGIVQESASPWREGDRDGEVLGATEVDIPYILHTDWRLSRHVRLGAGYNFGDFSEDEDDIGGDSEGVFIYLVGRM